MRDDEFVSYLKDVHSGVQSCVSGAVLAKTFRVSDNELRRRVNRLRRETELTDALTKLYKKYVPTPVREYIDEADAPAPAAPRPRRSPKPAAAKFAEEPEVVQ